MACQRWTKGMLALLLGTGTVAVLHSQGGLPVSAAAPPSRSRSVIAEENTMSMVRGRVEALLKNKHDDVDGFRLDDGTEVHFPPHIGKEVENWIGVGDRVAIDGEEVTRPKGEVVFEASRIESGGQSLAVDKPGHAHGPKPKGKPGPRHENEQPMNADGRVKAYATGPKGNVDGLILDDETVVKFPPHQSGELQAAVAIGDRVRIEGRRHETPKGEIHLHADRIVPSDSGKTLVRDEPGKRGPESGPKPKAKPTRAAELEPSNAEVLRELKAVRELLEKIDRH